jgi:hypothetical protein
MTLVEMKAAAYDLLANLEYIQKQLQEINAKIGEELQKEKAENG